MRGRLINPFLAELAVLDPAAQAADPDGAGPETDGYDPDFAEPVKLVENQARQENTVLVPCQVEVNAFEMQGQQTGGNIPDSRVTLVFHFADLERMGLVDSSTGEATLRVNTRLVAIRRLRDQSIIQVINAASGGLYCTESQPQSFGLSGGDRNLLVCAFEEREQGVKQ